MTGTWGDHMGLSITNAGPEDVERVRALGCRWIRTGIEECWDLQRFRLLLREAHDQGVKVLACVQPCPPRYLHWDLARLAQFCQWTQVVAGTGVNAIEVGNELNNPMFSDARDAAQTVAALLAWTVADAVHAGRPGLPVITNGWSPMGAEPDQFPQTAMHAMLLRWPGVLQPRVNGYGYHPYEMAMLPTTPTPVPAWNACWHLRDLHLDKPLWLTEFGFHGDEGDQAVWARSYFDAFEAHRAAGVNISKMFWHTLREGQSTVDESERTMGLLRPDGSEKPAGAVLREQAKRAW